jgi:hypothetical protein
MPGIGSGKEESQALEGGTGDIFHIRAHFIILGSARYSTFESKRAIPSETDILFIAKAAPQRQPWSLALFIN